MERIQAKGKKYVGKEIARLDRLLAEGKVSAEKRFAALLLLLLSSARFFPAAATELFRQRPLDFHGGMSLTRAQRSTRALSTPCET
jgi:hypothetical protein